MKPKPQELSWAVAVAVVVGMFVVAMMIVAYWAPDAAGAWITGLTALAVLWYTVDSSVLRKHADDAARRSRTPVLKFELVFPNGGNHLNTRCLVQNTTASVAIIRASVRILYPVANRGEPRLALTTNSWKFVSRGVIG